jgi:hypothetical protein
VSKKLRTLETQSADHALIDIEDGGSSEESEEKPGKMSPKKIVKGVKKRKRCARISDHESSSGTFLCDACLNWTGFLY